MKKTLFFIGFSCLLFGVTLNIAQASTLAEKLKGKILLQVESHGEAWYVNVNNGLKYYLGRPADAFNIMRKLGLGISNADFEKIKNNVPLKFAGKILLKVQDKGQAYYIDPASLKLYFLGRPGDAFTVMRSLGLGISNNDLNMIQTVTQDVTTNTATTTAEKTVGNNSVPIVSSIVVANGNDKGYVDFDDTITITFNEAIDPKSINNDLVKGSSVSDVYYYKTGGVSIATNGLVTITNIATFDMGSIEKYANFNVKVALDSTGKILTITFTGGIGDDTAITDESFSGATQISGIIKDEEGIAMLSSSVNSLLGTFGGTYDSNSGTPYIYSIKISNAEGDSSYIDTGDTVTITFNEAINPSSINDNLAKGSSVTGVPYSSTGGVAVSSTGKVTIKNIATFDMGSVEDSSTFTSKLELSSTGKILTVTLTSGSNIKIIAESYSSTNQTGGTIKDIGGKEMVTLTDITCPTGAFGGTNNDSKGPIISSVVVTNKGDSGYIDNGDTITISFDEAVDPNSINSDLGNGSYVTGISYTLTGGVSVSSAGKVTITNIATFDMGSVESAGNFTVKLALNSIGKILTITLTSGNDIEITDESFTSTMQISGTIKDTNGNVMASDSNACDSTGTFGGDNSNANKPHISSMVVTNNGDEGYIDTSDTIAITFSKAINPASINDDLESGSYITGVSYSSTGGVSISSTGNVTIKNIATFDMGSVGSVGTYTVKLALNSTGNILTITLTNGSDIEIISESFEGVNQISGTVEDNNENTMTSNYDICDPTGTFGGANNPYITSIVVINNGSRGYIDNDDIISITFNEAINPDSINSSLEKGSYVTGVFYTSTGGVSVSAAGKVTIKNIATFNMGSVTDFSTFTVKLALNSTGKILTITFTDGNDIQISNESFGSATQISGTIEDMDGNVMESNSNVCTPTGTFKD